ncbi:MAG: HAD-IA family hydrolase [Rhizobiales bacterium]|nr:HAD-IA family hydrolase [Hyphomicrobiales bacterium]
MSDTLIVFDVGSTLIHPNFSVLADWVAQRANAYTDVDVLERAFRRALSGDLFSINDYTRQADAFFTACGCGRSSRELWPAWWEEVVLAGGANSWLYTSVDVDAKETLNRLKNVGCRLIAASNSNGTLRAELDSFGLTDFFERTYDSADVGSEKPAPEFYDTVLNSSDAAVCVHVGDDLIKDFIGPLAAGFHRALLYDPADVYGGVPLRAKVRKLPEIGVVLGLVS